MSPLRYCLPLIAVGLLYGCSANPEPTHNSVEASREPKPEPKPMPDPKPAPTPAPPDTGDPPPDKAPATK